MPDNDLTAPIHGWISPLAYFSVPSTDNPYSIYLGLANFKFIVNVIRSAKCPDVWIELDMHLMLQYFEKEIVTPPTHTLCDT